MENFNLLQNEKLNLDIQVPSTKVYFMKNHLPKLNSIFQGNFDV